MQKQIKKGIGIKKRINVRTTWASHPPYFSRLIYSKMLKNAQEETQASKELALSWFTKYKSFDNTVPGKSYAMAVKNNSSKSGFPILVSEIIHVLTNV